jgi:FkbM family methyltransferase
MSTPAAAMKRAIAAAFCALPAAIREPVLRAGVVMPSAIKSKLFERTFAALAREAAGAFPPIRTNLGVRGGLDCRIPIAKHSYVFARPGNFLAERATYELAAELANDCRHFLDVGAHEGIYTFGIFARTKQRVALHWFEADRTLSQRLSANLRRNRIAARGNVVAVAEGDGETTFFRNLSDDASGSVSADFARAHIVERAPVDMIALATYLRRNRIARALVKIDVEGAGQRAWPGLAPAATRVSYLIIEMLAAEIAAHLPQTIIRSTGWHAFYIRDFELVESRAGEFEYQAPFWNWLFCSLTAPALARRWSGTKFRIVRAAAGCG